MQYDDSSDDNEEDHVEQRDKDSESEQELDNTEIDPENEKVTEDAPEVEANKNTTMESRIHQLDLFYTGKDKGTLWKKHCPPTNLRSYRAKSKNICTQLPGAKLPLRNLSDPVEIWKTFFDDSVIETIVTYTNQHIEKFARGKYSRETCRLMP